MKILVSFLVVPLLLVLLATVLAVDSYPASNAEAWCLNPYFERENNPGNYHAGWFRNTGSTPHGVKSYILNHDPFVWPNGSGSSAWVMLTGAAGQWAQIGWIEHFEDARNTFIQFTTPTYDPEDPNGTVQTFYYPPETIGTYTQYRIEYWGDFEYWAGSQGFGVSPNWFTPAAAQISGEILNLQTQMPGGYNSPAYFALAYIYTGGWIAYDGDNSVTNGYTPEFASVEYSPIVTGIWDKQCEA